MQQNLFETPEHEQPGIAIMKEAQTVTCYITEVFIMEGIDAIDFRVGDHLIQACGDSLIIFNGGDTTKPGCEIENSIMRRILAVAEEQVEDNGE